MPEHVTLETLKNSKRNLLGVLVNALDREKAAEAIIDCAMRRVPLSVAPVAVHAVMTGVLDGTQRYRLNRLGLVLSDGQPVRIALNRLYGAQLRRPVRGLELMYRVCDLAAKKGLPLYFYGNSEFVLKALEKSLRERFPGINIAGMMPAHYRRLTPEENQQMLDHIRSSGAAIAFIGLGTPQQHVWVYENTEELSIPILAVGAAFDFLAGRVKECPRQLQSAGLEWLYRLVREPKRLWKRYVFLNPLYLYLLALQLSGMRKFETDDGTKPIEVMRYG